jgi:DNA repair protein RadA/Sms
MSIRDKTLKCARCERPLLPNRKSCPHCGAVSCNFESAQVHNDEIVVLADAEDETVVRLSTGIPGVDRLFGGGIVYTSTNLIGGCPGSGKTTLELQVSDFVLDQHLDRKVMIFAAEQRPGELKGFAKRIGMKHMDRVLIVKAMGGMRSNLFQMLRDYKPILTIFDSLNELVGHDLELSVEVAKQIRDLIGTANFGPALLVGQVNKDYDIAGSEQLQHAVSGTFILDVDEVTKLREFCSLKNRNGRAPLSITMAMTEQGLCEVEEENEDE